MCGVDYIIDDIRDLTLYDLELHALNYALFYTPCVVCGRLLPFSEKTTYLSIVCLGCEGCLRK